MNEKLVDEVCEELIRRNIRIDAMEHAKRAVELAAKFKPEITDPAALLSWYLGPEVSLCEEIMRNEG